MRKVRGLCFAYLLCGTLGATCEERSAGPKDSLGYFARLRREIRENPQVDKKTAAAFYFFSQHIPIWSRAMGTREVSAYPTAFSRSAHEAVRFHRRARSSKFLLYGAFLYFSVFQPLWKYRMELAWAHRVTAALLLPEAELKSYRATESPSARVEKILQGRIRAYDLYLRETCGRSFAPTDFTDDRDWLAAQRAQLASPPAPLPADNFRVN